MGHGETKGILTSFYGQVKNARYGVLILDEIEKADPALYQMCLGMLDKATVMDGSNAELKFGNVIVIMTSNIGEKDRKRTTMGFPAAPIEMPVPPKIGSDVVTIEEAGKKTRALAIIDPTIPATRKNANSQRAEMLRLVFSPEFLGRLDGVVNFADLSHELVPLIADKFIAALQDQAKNNPRGAIKLELTPAARTYVAENGYKAEKGARSILNFMDEAIVGRLAEELIAGELEGGGNAVVDVEEDTETHQKKLGFSFSKAAGNKSMAATGSEIGAAMPDGSVYAGLSPDTGNAMYATPADTKLTYTFNEAKEYAAKLDAHGHQDWRVPTKGELNVLFENRAAIGGFDESGSGPAGRYWSSSQTNYYAWDQRFSDGHESNSYEDNDSSLRCVR